MAHIASNSKLFLISWHMSEMVRFKFVIVNKCKKIMQFGLIIEYPLNTNKTI